MTDTKGLQTNLVCASRWVGMVPLLMRDLRQSYVRNHEEAQHSNDDFETCETWVCKNRREKLAEWELTLTEAGDGQTND